MYYRSDRAAERKAYLALCGCSLTRAMYLDLLKSLEANGFIASLKRFIARRGRPKLTYSDNSTFQASAKWLRQIQKDERLNTHQTDLAIKWQFNLSRALLEGRSAGAINWSLQECLQQVNRESYVGIDRARGGNARCRDFT